MAEFFAKNTQFLELYAFGNLYLISWFLFKNWILRSTWTRSRITSMWLARTAQTSGGSPFRSFLWIRAPLQSLISNNQNITSHNTVDPSIPYFKILVQLFPSSYFWVLTGSLFSLWIFTPALVRSGSSLSSLHWKKDGALGKNFQKWNFTLPRCAGASSGHNQLQRHRPPASRMDEWLKSTILRKKYGLKKMKGRMY